MCATNPNNSIELHNLCVFLFWGGEKNFDCSPIERWRNYQFIWLFILSFYGLMLSWYSYNLASCMRIFVVVLSLIMSNIINITHCIVSLRDENKTKGHGRIWNFISCNLTATVYSKHALHRGLCVINRYFMVNVVITLIMYEYINKINDTFHYMIPFEKHIMLNFNFKVVTNTLLMH